jgi:hypothetical protein
MPLVRPDYRVAKLDVSVLRTCYDTFFTSRQKYLTAVRNDPECREINAKIDPYRARILALRKDKSKVDQLAAADKELVEIVKAKAKREKELFHLPLQVAIHEELNAFWANTLNSLIPLARQRPLGSMEPPKESSGSHSAAASRASSSASSVEDVYSFLLYN